MVIGMSFFCWHILTKSWHNRWDYLTAEFRREKGAIIQLTEILI